MATTCGCKSLAAVGDVDMVSKGEKPGGRPMQNDLMLRLIEGAAATIETHAEELTRLDQAIGDGDHGINMARGFKEVGAQKEAIASLPLGEGLQRLGTALVMKVGGASGPLYGTLFIEMGKAAPTGDPNLVDLSGMLDAGVAGVKARGKSERGMKTMLDVLCPVADTLRLYANNGDVDRIDERVIAAAGHALHATSMMEAKRGRASFLGPRSVGHIDPGACSSALLVGAIIGVLVPQT
jgi:phosphoenolpyruvate---glycerone phosphotransferase subunit DhaL